jgi:DNA polymerase I-like protein with 3'-5' exonuclease and polymerase domains
LVKNNIYSVKITAIKHIGKLPVYDFVTTGDKVMVANGFYTLDCVFGLMYGRGVKAIAKQYGITEDEAEAVRDLFFQKYPDASIWLDKQVQQAHEYKTVKTWMGRIRRLPEIDSYDKMVQAEAERQARNSPIQGLASDMNNHYMVMTLRLAKKEGITCYPMTTIHDANVIQVKKGQEESLINVMNKVVATAFPGFLCKMKLDFEIGTTLGTLEVVEL